MSKAEKMFEQLNYKRIFIKCKDVITYQKKGTKQVIQFILKTNQVNIMESINDKELQAINEQMREMKNMSKLCTIKEQETCNVEKMGLVRVIDKTKCEYSGKTVAVYEITTQGIEKRYANHISRID